MERSKRQLFALLPFAVGVAVFVFVILPRGGGQDIRTPALQDRGRIGVATVEGVRYQTSVQDRPGHRAGHYAIDYRFSVEGERGRSTGVSASDLADLIGEKMLFAYVPGEPGLELLLTEFPLRALAAVTATVTDVRVEVVPRQGLFTSERATSVRSFTYVYEGRPYQGLEPFGSGDPSDVGTTVTALIRKDAPDRAHLVAESPL